MEATGFEGISLGEVLFFGAVLAIVLLLIFRKVSLWYWKVDRISETLDHILEELKSKKE